MLSVTAAERRRRSCRCLGGMAFALRARCSNAGALQAIAPINNQESARRAQSAVDEDG